MFKKLSKSDFSFEFITGKARNWNQISSSMSFQLTSFFQFSARESLIIYVVVDSHALNWIKLGNWNSINEHIQFQLGTLPVDQRNQN